MENFQRMIYQEHASNPNTLGILIVERTQFDHPITDEFDSILLIIVENQEVDWFVKHYEVNDQIVAMHIVTKSLLMDWIDTSGYRRAAEWVIYGRKAYDRNEFVKELKEELQSFPEDKRTLRKMIDFGKLLKNFSEGKALYEAKEVMDSYSKILNALHYLARLSVIDQGYYPEVTVWNQVKSIDLEVYKLYEKLMDSTEDLEKRIELMLIAMDFVMLNKAETASAHLLNLLSKKDDYWSYASIKALPDIEHYTLDLHAIISYLEEKDIIDMKLVATKNPEVFQRMYKVKVLEEG
ncbi:nucleotidyltransferase-like protein [Oceanobacillus jeddahense]|uniref:nucleotidyltransferase-like protein n=1 Tax=Oceanobacillus jeddahense TaxID=1462527 RepID=UPI000596235D|nr:nucleotidyltransferase-like protein [Oceanobacillus jeddahense]